MKLHESAEDYLEKILMLQQKREHVRAIDIANDMNFSRASVSRAVKNLTAEGYLKIGLHSELLLTEKGREIAETMLQRHVKLSEFFISLGIDPDTAAADACRVEHDLSEKTYQALERFITEHQ